MLVITANTEQFIIYLQQLCHKFCHPFTTVELQMFSLVFAHPDIIHIHNIQLDPLKLVHCIVLTTCCHPVPVMMGGLHQSVEGWCKSATYELYGSLHGSGK